MGSGVIKKGEDNFPKGLVGILPSVEEIYWKGNFGEEFFGKRIAIVGSRKMTNYGKRVIERVVPVLVEAGVTIVSGMMYGVDQEVHGICLECGGKTIGVFGWGIERKPAGDDLRLYNKVEQKGLILSEYPDDMRPTRWMFVQRNRIVTALSDGVLVVEAAMKSGSLTTAEWARKYKKKLMAIPGQVTSSVSEGTNWLIANGRAELVSSGEDVLREVYGVEQMRMVGDNVVDGLGKWLMDEALTVGELAKKSGMSVLEIGKELGRLELLGKVEEEGGRYIWRV